MGYGFGVGLAKGVRPLVGGAILIHPMHISSFGASINWFAVQGERFTVELGYMTATKKLGGEAEDGAYYNRVHSETPMR